MSKDPAFLFYPNDWIGGTHYMSLEERGAYLTLLLDQFNIGPLSLDLIKKILRNDFEKVWPGIKDKFEVNGEGKFLNQRLEEEKQKRQRFSESRRNNRKGKTKEHMNNKSPSSDNHKGNGIGYGNDRNEIEFRMPNQSEIEGYLQERKWLNPKLMSEKIFAFGEESEWKRGKNQDPIKSWKRWIVSVWEKPELLKQVEDLSEEQILRSHGT